MDALRLRRLAIACGGALVVGALLVVVAKAAARWHHDDALWALAGWTGPFDLKVFLEAGDAVLAGRSPYPDPGTLVPPSSYYVYPPLLALVIIPLSVISVSVAASIFTVLGIAAVAGALYALDVRDWRCYVLAFAYPYTREALGYGAIGTFLALLAALAWRYRDDPRATGVASGLAIALKLFLAPLLLWLAFTRRVRAAAISAAAAVVLALVSWAVIGFAGLVDYPTLVRELSDLEAEQSYSAVAVLASIGLPSTLATILAVAGGAALLALAWRRARGDGPAGDRRSFILVIAAALVLTPILWLHYLVILVVPIALARPRLSWLWFTPLAALIPSWLDWYGGWANGDLPALLSTALVTIAVLVGALVPATTDSTLRAAAARESVAASS
jgi:Glycosyltransferase family 87